LSNRFIKDPSEAVKTGQIVKVLVLTVDEKTKRIALSIKALTASAPRPSKPAPQPQPKIEDQLAALSNKWRVRT
jgi:uncharacterized protein